MKIAGLNATSGVIGRIVTGAVVVKAEMAGLVAGLEVDMVFPVTVEVMAGIVGKGKTSR